MNEIVLTYELAKELQSIGTSNIPTVEGTVVKVEGNVMYLAASPSPTPDTFFGGLVEVLTGDGAGLRSAIVQSAGPQIILASRFGSYTPEAGDTVRLSGGPLASAKVFMFEPDTVRGITEDYIVTVNTLSCKLSLRSLGKSIKAWFSHSRLLDFEVVLEAPVLTGDGLDISTVRNALFNLKALKEQVEVMIINFRMNERLNLREGDSIESAYLMIQRTGSDVAKHAAVLDFSVIFG